MAGRKIDLKAAAYQEGMSPSTRLLRLPLVVSLLGLCGAGVDCAYADPPPAWSCTSGRCASSPAAGPHLQIVDPALRPLPAFQHGGAYVLGEPGARYLIRVVNPTGARLEAVVSVDGLDVLDGKPASFAKRGYLVPAYGEVLVEGWRTSLDAVAAFRFSSVDDSYAARTGRPRDVGVIGVAFFRERPPPPPRARPPVSIAPEGELDLSRKSAGAGGGASSGAARDMAPSPAAAAAAPRRPGLGTQFGEQAESHVSEVAFVRADASPILVSQLRYDDREGLLSRGIDIVPLPSDRDRENALRDTAEPFPASRFAQPPP
jgi:hypothetical protein